MYYINSKTDKPDAERLKRNVEAMMKRGIKIGNVYKICEQSEQLVDDLKKDIINKYNINNPNSTYDIGNYLRLLSKNTAIGEKDYVFECCYDKGKWVTNEAALTKLHSYGFEIAKDIIDYRKAKKNFDELKRLIEYADKDGLIHPTVSLTKTNRISYRNPALMNISKQILDYAIVPPEDGAIYSVDIKNQDPGVLINMIEEKTLMDSLKSEEGLYNNLFKKVFRPTARMNFLFDTFLVNTIYSPEEIKQLRVVSPTMYMPDKAKCNSWYFDNKRVVAIETICQGTEKGKESSRIFPETVVIETDDGETYNTRVEWEEDKSKHSKDYTIKGCLPDIEIRLQPNERKEFKTAFLALSYGLSRFGINNICKSIDGDLVYSTITKYPRMEYYRSMISKFANQGVTTLRTSFGTEVTSDKVSDVNELRRSLLSLPVQGTGADILDLLVERYNTEAKKKFRNMTNYIYYTRHDELRIFLGKDILDKFTHEELCEWLTDTLEHQIDNWVPFKVEVEKIKNGDPRDLMY